MAKLGNRILDALPSAELDEAQSLLERVDMGVKDYVYARGGRIEFVHFPVSCVISLVTEMEDGRAVEVATVGNEGMAGIPIFLQAAFTSAHEAFCQVPGVSLRMKADAFAGLSVNGGAMHSLLQRYTHALFVQVAQSSACNRLHNIEQRCARWILQTHDRVRSEEFLLTQEFLSQMLGVQRSSVNEAASGLQGRGAIRYTRGRIEVLDRPLLEARSCECYGVIAAEYERLIP